MYPVRHLGIVALCATLAALPLSAQEREVRSGVFRTSAAVTTSSDSAVPPPVDLMLLKSTGWSLLFGLSGGMVGMFIDDLYCESEHGDEEGFLFGPCFFYTATATPVGWFGGATIGASRSAIRMARQRGCTSPLATVRAVGGALIGIAPGAIVIAARSDHPSRGWFIGGAPFFAALGATLALQDCRS